MVQAELDNMIADHIIWYSTNGKSGHRAIFDDMDLSGLSLKEVNLVGVSMNRTKLIGCNASNSEFRDSNFNNADFKKSNLSCTRFIRCDLYQTNFLDANLKYIDLYDSDYKEAKFPVKNIKKGKIYSFNNHDIVMIINVAPNGNFDAIEGEQGEIFRDLPFWFGYGLQEKTEY